MVPSAARPSSVVARPSALLHATAARAGAGAGRHAGLRRRYRTVWISDVHLGTRAAKATELHAFLAGIECEHLYVVGDLIDGWRLERETWWPASHQAVLDELFRHAHAGALVAIVSGNHDEELREHAGEFGPVHCAERVEHVGADERRWLVVHGDRFDSVTGRRGVMTPIGDAALGAARWADRAVNFARRTAGRERVAVARRLQRWMKRGVCRMERWVTRMVEEARRVEAHGVVCGHFHEADLRERGGVVYANTGDWVHERTALVEREDGGIELVEWRGGSVAVRAEVTRARGLGAVSVNRAG